MADYKQIEDRIARALGLTRRPVAITFRDAPPPGVAKFEGSAPSGCTFWRLAVTGAPFYTVPADHHNCPIGSHTHNIPLPVAREKELGDTLTFMSGIGYLRMAEVPDIPRLPRTPGAIVYAALGETPVDPDVVLFLAKPGCVMLLHEAAIRAGVAAQVPMLGRPTCMALPAALASGTIASTSCIGNRVYTDLGDDELYVAVPGRDLQRLAAEVDTIAEANARLTDYHRGRRQALATP